MELKKFQTNLKKQKLGDQKANNYFSEKILLKLLKTESSGA